MTDLDSSQLFTVMQTLKTGRHGAFMAYIGEAYLVADTHNQDKLLKAFGEKFETIYSEYRWRNRLALSA